MVNIFNIFKKPKPTDNDLYKLDHSHENLDRLIQLTEQLNQAEEKLSKSVDINIFIHVYKPENL